VGARGAAMLIVEADVAVVERDLVAGRLACPGCRGVLARWGFARARVLRCRLGDLLLRPRRAKCRACAGTHVLLSDRALVRRQDEVAVIGAALVAMVAGRGHRRVAADAGLPVSTVRGWRRALVAGAEAIRVHFTRLAHALDPQLDAIVSAGSVAADALEAVAVAARAFVLRFGSGPVWSVVSALCGGLLLCHTSRPLFAAGAVGQGLRPW
jgi:hypothetical protein